MWTPLAVPVKLREDDGVYYRDKNAARYPAHPMEPMVQAVFATHPEPLEGGVDIVACGIGNTVHLIRRENSPKETIPNVRGYGHTFPEAYTTWDADVRGSASHQRILQYTFGGLRCIVRHEGDGYLRDKLTSSSKPKLLGKGRGSTLEELIASFEGNGVTSVDPVPSSELHIQPGGFDVPQSAVFDLKTRSNMRRGQDFLGEELPRMWVAQIPNFVLAYHNRGRFNDIEVMDVSEKIRDWEREMNGKLSQLAALLHSIIGLARTQPGGKLEISRQLLDRLEIRAQTSGVTPALSEGVSVKWASWLGQPVFTSRARVLVREIRAPELGELLTVRSVFTEIITKDFVSFFWMTIATTPNEAT
ncbi:hypothetical protein K4K57_007829 [Colletotrichum sp. SAR 10_99]|nr:hypothetical protein K4K57_007829 [Colletotrichum sp. SAR 10_99]